MNPVRLALRRLATLPGLSIAAIVSVALGIGANSLAFGALQGLLLRPLPFADADRLTWVFARATGDDDLSDGKLSTPEVSALAGLRSFAAIAVIGDRSLVVEGAGRHVQWHGLWVTPGLFRVLAVAPAAGRAFSNDDMGVSGPPAMMLGYERWVQDFAADPTVVGRVLAFADNRRFTVVGVLPPGLEFPIGRPPHAGNGSGFVPGLQDFWLLGQDNPGEFPGGVVLARIGDGVAPKAAAADARSVAATLAGGSTDGSITRTFELVGLREQLLGTLAPALPLVQAFAVLVLIVAAANLANLMCVRAIALERDGAIRLALGADSRHLTSALLAESGLLCAAGTAAGLALAWTAQQWLKAAASPYPAVAGRLDIGGPVLLFALLLSVVTAIVCALGPAALRTRRSLALLLGRNDARQTSQGSAAWRRTLVAAQVAITLVLLVGASLLEQSLHRLLSVDLGYQRARVVTADVLLFVPGRAVRAFYADLYPRLRALPGVEAVGLIQSTPLTGKWTFSEPLLVPGREAASPPMAGNFIAYDYFSAMGIPVLAGRPFDPRDLQSPNPPMVIVNDAAARRLFPGENALGRRVILTGKPREIVGIVQGTRDVDVDVAPAPQWYQPAMTGDSQLMVKVAGEPSRFVETLRATLLAADPRLIVKRIAPLEAIVAERVFERRMTGRLVTGFAAIALLLAVAGLYGVMSAGAAQRRQELGLRAALGARPADLVRLLVKQGLALAAVGASAGVVLALAGAGLLRHLLFETAPTDWVTFAASTLLLMLVSAAACVVPAWRAAAVDPAETLRVS